MDTESLQADLVSLRKLYRLLQISGSADGNQSSEALDEGSRRLLKRLLDNATEKLYHNHLKILASSWRSLILVPSSAQLDAAPQVHSSRLPPVSPYSSNGQRGNKNDQFPSEASKEDAPTSSVYRPHNDDTPSTTMIAPTNFTTESQNQRKRCLICERKDSRKDLASTPRYSSHEKIQQERQEYRLGDWYNLPFPMPGRGSAVEVGSYMNPDIEKQKIHHLREQLRGSGSKSSMDMGEVKGKHDSSHAIAFLSSEVDDTVKRIESLIPSLQRLASRRALPGEEETVSSNQEFLSFSGSTNSLDGISVNSSTEQGCHVREADLKQIHRIGQFSERKANYALDKRMSASHLNNIQRVHDQTDYQRKVITMKNLEPRSVMSPPFGSERFIDHAGNFDNNKLDGDLTKVAKDYKIPPYKKNEFQKVHGKRSRRRKGGWASQKEPEGSSYSTADSLASSWTTTASETTCLTSDSWTEESQSTTCFSTTCESQQGISDHRRLNAGSGGSSSSEYTASYPYSGQDSDDDSDDGYYVNEVAASTSRRRTDPFRFKHKWSIRYRDRVNHEGRFRRLKNKLGMILHRRHGRYPNGGKYNDGYRKEHNVRSLWKQLGKIFRHVEDEERNDSTFRSWKRKAKSKKGQDKNVVAARKRVVTRKDQAGHFQSLVNGLISHMRRKKKARDGMIATVGGRGGKTMKNTTLSRMSIGGRKGKGGIGVPAMGKMKGRTDNNTRIWPQLKAVET